MPACLPSLRLLEVPHCPTAAHIRELRDGSLRRAVQVQSTAALPTCASSSPSPAPACHVLASRDPPSCTGATVCALSCCELPLQLQRRNVRNPGPALLLRELQQHARGALVHRLRLPMIDDLELRTSPSPCRSASVSVRSTGRRASARPRPCNYYCNYNMPQAPGLRLQQHRIVAIIVMAQRPRLALECFGLSTALPPRRRGCRHPRDISIGRWHWSPAPPPPPRRRPHRDRHSPAQAVHRIHH